MFDITLPDAVKDFFDFSNMDIWGKLQIILPVIIAVWIIALIVIVTRMKRQNRKPIPEKGKDNELETEKTNTIKTNSTPQYPDDPIPPLSSPKAELALMGECGYYKGKKMKITEERVTIGREKSCSIQYPASYPGISKLHASIIQKDDIVYLVDEGSTYGTFLQINQEKPFRLEPHKVYILKPGYKFYLSSQKECMEIAGEQGETAYYYD